MTRRAWWLFTLNLLVPGTAQILSGNRKLGRFALRCTVVFWLVAIALVVLFVVNRHFVISVFTQTVWLVTLAVVLSLYALLWFVLALDTLRLMKLPRVRVGARTLVVFVSLFAITLSSGTAAYAAYLAGTTSNIISAMFRPGASVPPINGRYNILLLGGDAGSDRQGLRPDSMNVISVDANTGKAIQIGIPRDLDPVPFVAGSPMAKLYPDGYGANGKCDVDVCQMNSIYTEAELKHADLYPNAKAEGSSPGIEATKDAAEGVTGLTIQFYVLIEMSGFQQLVDALGGVTVNVTTAVPIHTDATFTTVAEWIPVGTDHLDGFHALWYARSRHGSSDYDRMARQRQLQDAILAQFTPATVLTKLQAIGAATANVFTTDVPQGMLGYLLNLADKTRTQPVGSVALVPANGVDPTNPDYTLIRKMIDDGLAGVQPSSASPSG